MKIGILYICTGRYEIFWDGFYESAEKYLMPDKEKHYFVFTDSDKINNHINVTKIPVENPGWPHVALKRFHYFADNKSLFGECDYLFFYNANYTFIKPIYFSELCPTADENHLVGQQMPAIYHRRPIDFPNERRQISTAYIPLNSELVYFGSGHIGGRTKEFLEMSDVIKNNVDIDYSNNIIAIWHDESHVNKYFLSHKPKVLHPGYCYPQDWFLPFPQMTLLLDKNKLGGHSFLRGDESENKFHRLKAGLFYTKQLVRAGLYKMLGYSPL